MYKFIIAAVVIVFVILDAGRRLPGTVEARPAS